MAPMTSLDLFTGIGGMTRALEGISTPLAYCECDPTRLRVIETLISREKIPRAPVFMDVRTFDYSVSEVDMVVGSWPCKGFSTAGLLTHFDHPQSALFRDFARIVQYHKPKLIYQENVPGVAGAALDEVIEQFGDDYDLVWVVFPAYMVGAPHIRKRWFCLGVRKDVTDITLHDLDCFECTDWASCAIPRMTLDVVPNSTNRLSMLGNAVVPQCARLAFLAMFTGFTIPLDRLLGESSLTLSRPDVSGALPLPAIGDASRGTPSRYFGCTRDGKTYKLRVPVPPKPDIKLVLRPEAYTGTSDIALEENLVTEDVQRQLWATPRGGATASARVLTFRGCNDLSTQLRFELGTPDALRPGKTNPCFVEWMMGFPEDWTVAE